MLLAGHKRNLLKLVCGIFHGPSACTGIACVSEREREKRSDSVFFRFN
jgi:hypothetical protein